MSVSQLRAERDLLKKVVYKTKIPSNVIAGIIHDWADTLYVL